MKMFHCDGQDDSGNFQDVMMLRVSPEEAMQLIRSLSGQLVRGDPNSERLDTVLEDGCEFSIAVSLRNPDGSWT